MHQPKFLLALIGIAIVPSASLFAMDKFEEKTLRCNEVISAHLFAQKEKILIPSNQSNFKKKNTQPLKTSINFPKGFSYKIETHKKNPSIILSQQKLYAEQQKNLAIALKSSKNKKFNFLAWQILFNRQFEETNGVFPLSKQIRNILEVDCSSYVDVWNFVSRFMSPPPPPPDPSQLANSFYKKSPKHYPNVNISHEKTQPNLHLPERFSAPTEGLPFDFGYIPETPYFYGSN